MQNLCTVRSHHKTHRFSALIFFLLAFLLLIAVRKDTVSAQGPVPNILRDVAFEQRLDAQVPLDIEFRDESGQVVRLNAYFGSKPVVLTLNYFYCPNLCPLILDALVGSLADLPFSIGQELNLISVSIDPRETPSLAFSKKQLYVKRYARAGADEGWHFLTGEQPSIERLTQAVGFRYAYDAAQDQYAHPAGIIVLTPQGKISRYLYGTEFSSQDLRLALVEASQNRIGSLTDQLLLVCYRYDPATGKYSTLALDVTRWCGLFTVLGLGIFLTLMWRRDLRRDKTSSSQTPLDSEGSAASVDLKTEPSSAISSALTFSQPHPLFAEGSYLL